MGKGKVGSKIRNLASMTFYTQQEAQEVQAVEGDSLPAEDLDWEAAALAWGLTAAGGLGCGSAGVFGGECISR